MEWSTTSSSSALVRPVLLAARQLACAGRTVALIEARDRVGDPFARGAYSFVLVGAEDARAALAAPIDGMLWFAGEATAGREGATVAGALQSGMRAAHESPQSARRRSAPASYFKPYP